MPVDQSQRSSMLTMSLLFFRARAGVSGPKSTLFNADSVSLVVFQSWSGCQWTKVNALLRCLHLSCFSELEWVPVDQSQRTSTLTASLLFFRAGVGASGPKSTLFNADGVSLVVFQSWSGCQWTKVNALLRCQHLSCFSELEWVPVDQSQHSSTLTASRLFLRAGVGASGPKSTLFYADSVSLVSQSWSGCQWTKVNTLLR